MDFIGKTVIQPSCLDCEAIVEFYRAQGSDSDLDEFQDEQFINDFAFAVDIISHLNKLNTLLQGESKVISDL